MDCLACFIRSKGGKVTRPLSNEDTLIYKPASIVEQLPVAAMFPVAQPLEVEIGAGDGSFLAAYATAHPETNFIGIERLLGRLRKIDRKARRAALKNLRLMRIEASYFVKYLLPRGAVRAIHIYFPDPWPKRRHWKNRLITPEFTEVVRGALQAGGEIHLRTDDEHYFTQMVDSFMSNSNFEKVSPPQSLVEFTTDFERGFTQRGVATRYASYIKRK
jgi:tRNA (guanine-N7-)-methyltransferase